MAKEGPRKYTKDGEKSRKLGRGAAGGREEEKGPDGRRELGEASRQQARCFRIFRVVSYFLVFFVVTRPGTLKGNHGWHGGQKRQEMNYGKRFRLVFEHSPGL